MKKYLFLTFLLAGVSVGSSQTLNKEITIKKDIVPEEMNFSPLNTLPKPLSFSQPEVRLEYNMLGIPSTLSASRDNELFSLVNPAISTSTWRGYVDAGYFPLYNTSVSAGYRIIDTSADKLAAWTQFTGYSWKNRPVAGSEEAVKLNDNNLNLGVAYSHAFNASSAIDVKAQYSGYWYNVPTGNTSVSDAVNDVKGEIGWTKSTSLQTISIKGRAKFFSMRNPWVENHTGGAFKNMAVKLRGEILFASDPYVKSRFKGIRIEFEELHSGYKTFYSNNMMDAAGNINDALNVGISFMLSHPSYYINLGVRPSFALKGEAKKATLAPDIEATYKFSNFATITTYFKGGDRITSLDDIFACTHYVNPYYTVNFTRVPLDFGARLSIGAWKGFHAALKGGYNKGNDWLMPYGSLGTFSNVLTTKGAYLGVEAGYNWNETVDVQVSWLMVPGNDKAYYLLRDRAKNVIDLKISVQPIDPLIIDATFNGRFGRRFMLNETEHLDAGNVLNLGLGARYSFSENFGAFLRGENLLNRHWTSIAGPAVEMPGIRGLVGISFRF